MLDFKPQLQPARLLRRYKRFLADIVFADGSEAVAHVANSGSMLGCAEPGMDILVSANTNPKAKLDWRWEMVRDGDCWVGINTARPNRLVENAIAQGLLAPFVSATNVRREVKYGHNSRIDLLADIDGRETYIEIKNVTMRRGQRAAFPDAVTARGTKHLGDLADMVAKGHRAIMFYVVNRDDCEAMTLASDIDPAYAKTLAAATAAGVETLAYSVHNTPERAALAKPLNVVLP